MKLAIIGASGFVGSQLLKEAILRKHEVTAVVRKPERIAEKNPSLKVIALDVLDTEALSVVLKGQDMVISAYNPGWGNPDIYSDFLKGSASIQEAVKKSGVKRFLVIGGAGSLEVSSGLQLIDTPQFPAEWKNGALGARDYLTVLKKEQDMEWTYFSPAILMHHGIDSGRTGQYRLGLDSPVRDENGVSKLSVEDLAIVILDEVEKKQFVRKRFTAAY